MTEIVNIYDAKAHLSRLVDRTAADKEVLIARASRLARNYERLPEMLAGQHLVTSIILLLRGAGDLAVVHSQGNRVNKGRDNGPEC